MAAVVTMKQLLESGVHFGHQTRRWNPKMKRFIFTERNGIYIIDLQQSLDYIDRAYEFIKETVAHGGTILYVGTKKQAQEAIAEQARRVGMPFVNQRWLGGMLTNFGTVFKRLQRLKELEEVDFDDVAGSTLTKKELLHLRRERDKLDRSLGGIRHMTRVPSAIWVVDTKKEHIAVSEARKLGIPVIAILDTNCDPDEVTYPIPGNDDAIRSVALLTRVIADAVADGLIARAGAADGEEKPSTALDSELGSAEPLAEWERELLPSRPADETGSPAANGVDVAANGSATAPADGSPAEAAPADAAPADAAPADAAPATAASAGTAPTEAATPETATSEAAAPEAAAPEAAAPEAAAPEAAAPEAAAPEAAAPEAAAPEAAAPEAAAPEAAAPEAASSDAASNGAAGPDAAGTEPADSGADAATGTPADAEASEASSEA
jgi:small subunit ribosomal protein S2